MVPARHRSLQSMAVRPAHSIDQHASWRVPRTNPPRRGCVASRRCPRSASPKPARHLLPRRRRPRAQTNRRTARAGSCRFVHRPHRVRSPEPSRRSRRSPRRSPPERTRQAPLRTVQAAEAEPPVRHHGPAHRRFLPPCRRRPTQGRCVAAPGPQPGCHRPALRRSGVRIPRSIRAVSRVQDRKRGPVPVSCPRIPHRLLRGQVRAGPRRQEELEREALKDHHPSARHPVPALG